MARGWESKSVEEQQEEARRARSVQPTPPPSEEERARQHRRDELQLALSLTQSEIQAACHPKHRDMLRLRLEAIEKELDQYR